MLKKQTLQTLKQQVVAVVTTGHVLMDETEGYFGLLISQHLSVVVVASSHIAGNQKVAVGVNSLITLQLIQNMCPSPEFAHKLFIG